MRRRLLAHDLTAERFVVGPLRHLHLLGADRLGALEEEAHRLSRDALVLARGEPDRAAVAAFVHRLRDLKVRVNRDPEVDLLPPGLAIRFYGKRVPYEARGPGVIELRIQGDLAYPYDDLLLRGGTGGETGNLGW